jgi:hypothetical protein
MKKVELDNQAIILLILKTKIQYRLLINGLNRLVINNKNYLITQSWHQVGTDPRSPRLFGKGLKIVPERHVENGVQHAAALDAPGYVELGVVAQQRGTQATAQTHQKRVAEVGGRP